MDDTNNISQQKGDQCHHTAGQSSSRQLPFNDTTSRAGEWTCTQKLTIPILEKYDNFSANLWRRKFVQSKEIDISTMVNSKEIIPQYRDQLETEIKDIFRWAIDQNALTEINKTVLER